MFNEAPCQTLMVKGLNALSTEESVRQSLGKFGAISSIKVLPVAAGKTTAASFISFATLEEAMWIAENINGMTLPGEAAPLEIVYAPPRDTKGGKGKGGKFDAPGPYSMTGSLHKTKMCSFFQSQGFCAKGDLCGFAHGAHELNGCGKGSLGGKGGVGGMGGMDHRKGGMGGMGGMVGMGCSGMGGMGGMGGGMWGGMSGGMKGSWPQPGGALKAANDGIKSKMCSFWEDRGFCAKGTACSFAHGAHELGKPVASVGPSGDGAGGLWKTKSCKFFDLGTCQKGSNCNFAHGDHELLKA